MQTRFGFVGNKNINEFKPNPLGVYSSRGEDAIKYVSSKRPMFCFICTAKIKIKVTLPML